MIYRVWYGSLSDKGIYDEFYDILSSAHEDRDDAEIDRDDAEIDRDALRKLGFMAWIEEKKYAV